MRMTPEELARNLVVGIELEPRVMNLTPGREVSHEEDSLKALGMARACQPENLPARAGECNGAQYFWGQIYPDLQSAEVAGIECREPAEGVLNVFVLIQLLSCACNACNLRLALRSDYYQVPSSIHLNLSFGREYAPPELTRATAQAALALQYGNPVLAPIPVLSQRAQHVRCVTSKDWKARPLIHLEGGKECFDLPPPWIADDLKATEAGRAFLVRCMQRTTARNHDSCYDLQPCPATTLKICESHAIILMLTLLGELPQLNGEGLDPLAFLRQHNRLIADADGRLLLPEPVRAINRKVAEHAVKLAERHPDAFPPFFVRRAADWLAESSMSTEELAVRCRIHGQVKWYAALLPFLRERGRTVQEYLQACAKESCESQPERPLPQELALLLQIDPTAARVLLHRQGLPSGPEGGLLCDIAALDLLLDMWDHRASRSPWPGTGFFQEALRAGPRKVNTRADARSELLKQLLAQKAQKAMFYWTGAVVTDDEDAAHWVPMPDVLDPVLTQERLAIDFDVF